MNKDLVVIIINPSDQVLLIKYDGTFGHYAFKWGLPEGKMNANEQMVTKVASILWDRLKLSEKQIITIEPQPIEINHISNNLEQWVVLVQVNFDDESIWGDEMVDQVRFFSEEEFKAAAASDSAVFHIIPTAKEIIQRYFDTSK